MTISIISCGEVGEDTNSTVSWIGPNAVELTLVSRNSDTTVGFIIKKAGQEVPTYSEVRHKVGFLVRQLTANTPQKVYTAMHYDTNNNIKNNIDWADILQANTKYKAYIFDVQNKEIIETISFGTQLAPTKEEMRHVRTDENEIIYSIKTFPARKKYNRDINIIYVKGGENLLIPIYFNTRTLTSTLTIYQSSSEVGLCDGDDDNKLNNCRSSESRYLFAGKEYLPVTNSEEYGQNVYSMMIIHINNVEQANDMLDVWSYGTEESSFVFFLLEE